MKDCCLFSTFMTEEQGKPTTASDRTNIKRTPDKVKDADTCDRGEVNGNRLLFNCHTLKLYSRSLKDNQL